MKLILNKIKKIDSKVYKVYISGLKFCLVLILFACFILSLYQSIHNPDMFYIGFSLAKSSLFFAVFFLMFSVVIDTITNNTKK